jgi:chromosome transmission fidelity protein 1
MYAKDIYEISLASRKNMCINEEVSGLGNVNKINEACLDLQKSGKYQHRYFFEVNIIDRFIYVGSKKGPCKYLPSADNVTKWNEFRDHALVDL